MTKMKSLITLSLSFIFFITPFFVSAQSFDWQGRWEAIVSRKTFCNIHIVTDLIDGQSKPTAILEGLINEKPFRITCDIKEIPQRNSIVLHKAADVEGHSEYKTTEPLLILALNKVGNQYIVNPVWVQLDLTKGYANKSCVVRKVSNPRYRGTYTLSEEGVKTALTISKVKRDGFQATVETSENGITCDCRFQAKHLAVCYPNDERGVFYLDFNEYGVKMVQNYDHNIYSSESVKGNGPLVLNTTLTK
ncbi:MULTISPECIES: hypothetical protein [unclassified Aureispira]|uniref:hypothetical protein n=1 Tax=unclassified Aureispira TaxID=2649989 RepID=UPI00069778C4|nr:MULTISPECIES: hypothetical protein [unclassified Aureispira]WMX16491.1 hypothetical protein QP953_08930 [Aureispira sp. CCB-E]